MTYTFIATTNKNPRLIYSEPMSIMDFERRLTIQNIEFEKHNSRRNSEVVFFNFNLNGQDVTIKATPIN